MANPSFFTPDFFIIGAPKAGTTSLYAILAQTPQLYGSTPKEPNFFASDIKLPVRIETHRDYSALFDQAAPGQMCFEASVIYAHSKTAIPAILKERPDAKFILMLRNPVDILLSQYQQLRFQGSETASTFEKAWNERYERDTSEYRLNKSYGPILAYHKTALFGAMLERLYAQIPQENLLVLIYEEFFTDFEAGLKTVSDFLGVPIQHDIQIHSNKSKEHRFSRLAAFLATPPEPLASLKRGLKSLLNINQTKMMRWIAHLNTRPAQKPSIDTHIRQDILQTYAQDRILLERLLGRPISAWAAQEFPKS